MAKLKKLPLDGSCPELWTPDSDWKPWTGPLPVPRGEVIGLDTETRDGGLARDVGPGWVYDDGHLCGVSMAWGDRKLYIPIRHPDTDCRPLPEVLAWVEDILRHCTVCFFNMGYDMAWLQHEGVTVWPERAHDASIMSVMLDENQMSYSLDDCCYRADVPCKDTSLLEEAARSLGVDPKTGMWQMPARFVGPYAEQDAVSTLQLCTVLLPIIDEQRMRGAYQTEIDLVPVLHDMRRRGIPVNSESAERAQAHVRTKRQDRLDEIGRFVGRRVIMGELQSGEACGRLFDTVGVICPRTPKTKTPSVKKEWLEQVDHPMGRLVREARQFNDLAEKFIGTYIMEHQHRGRVHAVVHQLRDSDGGARTQRLSYSSPPLHQMPARPTSPEQELLVALIRDIFESERGEVWAAPDYCFADDTEILTSDGFVLLRDLPDGARCAQVDLDTRQLSYAKPTARQVVRYIGPIKHLLGRQTDLLMTPNHRCPLYKYQTNNYEIISAQDYVDIERDGDGWDQLGAAVYLPPNPIWEDEDLLRLVVAAQADATLRTGKNGSALRWQLRKQRKIDRLLWLLGRMGIRYSYTPAGYCKASIHIAATDVPLSIWRWLTEDKTLSRDLLQLPLHLRQVVIDELPLWDGSGGSSFDSTNIANAELAQELLIVSGRKCTSSRRQRAGRVECMGVSWSARDRSGIKNTRKTTEHYDGTVYCVTMPLHTVVVRRNGKVSVTGNSGQEPRIMVHLANLAGIHGAAEIARIYQENPDTDYHTMVAGIIGLPRKKAKDINQGLAYGMGLAKLAKVLNVGEEEAKGMLDLYTEKLPYIGGLTDHCSNLAQSRGWIRLLDGARCHFDQWQPRGARQIQPVQGYSAARKRWSGGSLERAYTYRAANRAAQGGAARQMKRAMVAMHKEDLRLMVQMHDEVGISVSTRAEAERARVIMIETTKLTVPVKVDLEVGSTWGKAKYSAEEWKW